MSVCVASNQKITGCAAYSVSFVAYAYQDASSNTVTCTSCGSQSVVQIQGGQACLNSGSLITNCQQYTIGAAQPSCSVCNHLAPVILSTATGPVCGQVTIPGCALYAVSTTTLSGLYIVECSSCGSGLTIIQSLNVAAVPGYSGVGCASSNLNSQNCTSISLTGGSNYSCNSCAGGYNLVPMSQYVSACILASTYATYSVAGCLYYSGNLTIANGAQCTACDQTSIYKNQAIVLIGSNSVTMCLTNDQYIPQCMYQVQDPSNSLNYKCSNNCKFGYSPVLVSTQA
jgi:hypothetical protein